MKENRLKNGKDRVATQLLGQAGVWAVAAQLAIRGHIPLFPGVDYGYDIMLESGLRIQVKARSLRLHPAYRGGEAYCFDVCGAKWDNEAHKLRKVTTPHYVGRADHYVLWGVDENRFWIVPVSEIRTTIHFSRKSPLVGIESKASRLAKYEDRWDLLDVNETAKEIVESVEVNAPGRVKDAFTA